MERGITVLLQDVSQLTNIGRTHIWSDNENFKIELFLNYKETLGNFCSTTVNTVSQSLQAELLELSVQLTNLHYDIDRNKKTSMDYLSPHFFQINDNVVNVENDVAYTTTVRDMQKKIKYCSRFERGSNSPEPLADEIINPSD